jgi:hypothetical protein
LQTYGGIFDGILEIKAKLNIPFPRQIISGSLNPDVTDMISLQLKLLEEVSDIQGALQ